MSEKRKNEAGFIPRYKNKNLNKIQRSNEWVAQDKDFSWKENWFIMMVFKTKGPAQFRCIPHGSLGLSSM